jgi:hypothetical protein
MNGSGIHEAGSHFRIKDMIQTRLVDDDCEEERAKTHLVAADASIDFISTILLCFFHELWIGEKWSASLRRLR